MWNVQQCPTDMLDWIIVGKMCFPRFCTCFPIEMVISGYTHPLFGQLHMCVCVFNPDGDSTKSPGFRLEGTAGGSAINCRHWTFFVAFKPREAYIFHVSAGPISGLSAPAEEQKLKLNELKKKQEEVWTNTQDVAPKLKDEIFNLQRDFCWQFPWETPRNANLPAAIPGLCGPTLQLCWGKTVPVPPLSNDLVSFNVFGFVGKWMSMRNTNEIPKNTKNISRKQDSQPWSSGMFMDVPWFSQ